MGLIPGTKVTLQKVAPMGDPIEIRVRGYELTLRVEDGQKNSGGGGKGMIFALAGNQNCGKTTLLTPLPAPTSMWAISPGVTVDQKIW